MIWQGPARRVRAGHVIAPFLLAVLFLAGCAEPDPERRPAESRHPLVVIGIDGAEWTVIEDLWRQGRLPHLEALAEAGVRTHLLTDYGKSPVIWTTMATGRFPTEHGITDFVVPSDTGPVPVSSRTRRVPALWDMTSRVGLRTLALGWWATWPAEPIHGVMISDRAHADLDDTFSPPEWASAFREIRSQAQDAPDRFRGNPETRTRDEIVARAAAELARDPFALMLVYFRSVDIESHQTWRYYRPETFEPPEPAELAAKQGRIPQSYEATDEAIGALVAVLDGRANIIVVSDHGFHAMSRERSKVALDVNGLLVHLGYAKRGPEGDVTCAHSELVAHGSDRSAAIQGLRLCRNTNTSMPLDRLARDLGSLTWEQGAPAFTVQDASPRIAQRGAHLELHILDRGASRRLVQSGKPIDGLVSSVWTVSGDHGPRTHGIFVAAGPDIDPAANPTGITIHDIAPTVLYMLGLPVADDFAGRAWTELLEPRFRQRRALRSIASWGTRASDVSGTVLHSDIDDELVDELRALGYL